MSFTVILAPVKFTSQIIAAASGSVGGCVFSRNRFGAYTRNRAIPVNPASNQQQILRSALGTLVQRWTGTLTSTQRAGWENWAANTPQTDALGNPYNMTGQNAYVSMNSTRIQTSQAILDTAPIIFAGAALTPPAIVSATASTEAISVSFTNTDLWATAVGGQLYVYCGRPQNPTKLFFKGPYRFSGKISGAVTPPTSPMSITSQFPFEVGQRVHVRFRAQNSDGRLSTITRASALGV